MSKGLDINTAKGQRTLMIERDVAKALQTNGWNLIETDKSRPAKVDYLRIDEHGILSGVVEIKTRNYSYQEMQRSGSAMEQSQKLDSMVELSKMLCVPSYFVYYCIPDRTVVIWQLTSNHGKPLFDSPKRYMSSQKTVNGGTVMRYNSFIPLSEAQEMFRI